MQRIKSSDRNFLFVSDDVELNPGPVNTSNMSVLTTRLARIGRKPVNIVRDGNCLFRSVSHQLYRTESRHAQIRALACHPTFNKRDTKGVIKNCLSLKNAVLVHIF
jgi:hypothetical protein